jgi:hypothetical protein
MRYIYVQQSEAGTFYYSSRAKAVADAEDFLKQRNISYTITANKYSVYFEDIENHHELVTVRRELLL